jgi:hypothetical protein
MNTIVANILMREAVASRTQTKPLVLIMSLCGVGLATALGLASLGFDLGASLF